MLLGCPVKASGRGNDSEDSATPNIACNVFCEAGRVFGYVTRWLGLALLVSVGIFYDHHQ